VMSSSKHARFLLLLFTVIITYSIFGSYFYTMDEIWRIARRMEVLNNEIFHLSTSAEREREAIAPLVLRLFAFSREDGALRVYYSGEEIWSGSEGELNITYNVEGFGYVSIRAERGRIIASTRGYFHEIGTSHQENLSWVVKEGIEKALAMEEAAVRDRNDLERMKNLLKSISWSPLMFSFLLTPVISLLVQHLLLRRESLSGRYAELVLNPYLLIPFLSAYLMLVLLTAILNSGVLIPLHAILAAYILTAIPSLVSPILYAYERIVE